MFISSTRDHFKLFMWTCLKQERSTGHHNFHLGSVAPPFYIAGRGGGREGGGDRIDGAEYGGGARQEVGIELEVWKNEGEGGEGIKEGGDLVGGGEYGGGVVAEGGGVEGSGGKEGVIEWEGKESSEKWSGYEE